MENDDRTVGPPENKFDLINRVRLRSRQLGDGAIPRIPARIDEKLVTVAIDEVLAGTVDFERLPPRTNARRALH